MNLGEYKLEIKPRSIHGRDCDIVFLKGNIMDIIFGHFGYHKDFETIKLLTLIKDKI